MPIRPSIQNMIDTRGDGKPLMWVVFCPPGHEYDWLTFPDQREATTQALEFADEEGDESWEIYPLTPMPPISVS